ncbi:Amidohydrolase [Pigmentiphaga humi]|uniref:Amidohydrolase n=1 Tax=Pigmentiphaga humi TaxID=2478468 RepID=A0A3P4AYI0_9BURK|nr:amidohydrolase family protein [Pigmentiphaga humi]VCU68621.1 Amidohydrolase [Pigmentiphaga humi]
MQTHRKIALEEHFMMPGFEEYSNSFLSFIDPATQKELAQRLNDFDELRLDEMDRAAIDLVVLSQSGPGVQAEPDGQAAIAKARANNDFLAERIARHPERYAGFAMLPMHDPLEAARELERCVAQMGFKGSLVNGHTLGRYYESRDYDPFWARMQELDVPMYLHPAYPWRPLHALEGMPVLTGASWGWGVETASHALRLLFGGVFDRFPGLKVILGHMGEFLPFQRWRLDSRFAAYPFGIELERQPSQYIGSNLVITTSGVCSHPTLLGAVGEIGADAVMFSVDYPYESTEAAAAFIDSAPLPPDQLEAICHGNAARLLKL